MKLTKDEVNNAIITQLTNVRKHPNADKLQLATVLGTTVIVGLESHENDKVIYFDSNLRLSPDYLKYNNLYSNQDLNKDKTKKGYFGSNGRVKATKLRGELSNGYVTNLSSLFYLLNPIETDKIKINTEFTHINSIEICAKYVIPNRNPNLGRNGKKNCKIDNTISSKMFVRHWDTKQFKREYNLIPSGIVYIEEKIHGTSARVGNMLSKKQLSLPERILKKLGVNIQMYDYKCLNASRNIVLTRYNKNKYRQHIQSTRNIIFAQLKPHLKKGEQLYFEIFGYETTGKCIQKDFSYGCKLGEYKAMLYRVTQNNEDGEVFDMSREYVYNRAEELGLMKPILFDTYIHHNSKVEDLINNVNSFTDGKSTLDNNTIREGVVIWFKNNRGQWTCLKNKSDNFLLKESKLKDDDNYVDVEEEG
jgi:hypothetical protein